MKILYLISLSSGIISMAISEEKKLTLTNNSFPDLDSLFHKTDPRIRNAVNKVIIDSYTDCKIMKYIEIHIILTLIKSSISMKKNICKHTKYTYIEHALKV